MVAIEGITHGTNLEYWFVGSGVCMAAKPRDDAKSRDLLHKHTRHQVVETLLDNLWLCFWSESCARMVMKKKWVCSRVREHICL